MSDEDRPDDRVARDAESDDDEENVEANRPRDDAPLSELAERVADRRQGKPSVDETGDDPFEEMSVPEIDGEALWESVGVESDDRPPGFGLFGDASTSTLADDAAAPEHVVEKETYCQKCPHLADPPELACTHEGTEIVEVVDSDHFRVRNCPMIEE